MGPISSTITRLYGTRGWLALGAFAFVLFVVFPLLSLVVPQGNPFHVSAYGVTLLGKIMCYAIVALAMDLIWGYTGILSLGHGLFFALGGYSFGRYRGGDRPSQPDITVLSTIGAAAGLVWAATNGVSPRSKEVSNGIRIEKGRCIGPERTTKSDAKKKATAPFACRERRR